MAQIGWDFRSLAAVRYAGQPLKTASSIAFPETITYDVATDRYELRYMTSWGIPTAETVSCTSNAQTLGRPSARTAIQGHPDDRGSPEHDFVSHEIQRKSVLTRNSYARPA
jgi:hypothetical protein